MKLTCKEATVLVSAAQDRRLRPGEWLALRLHLMICVACARFARQASFLRAAARRAWSDLGAVSAVRLSAAARRRIVQSLRRRP
jgi:hypothetical protein